MSYAGTLTMPSSFAVMEEDEMMYLEGGYFVSKTDCINGIAAAGMNPSTFINAALTVALVSKAVRWVATKFGGIWGVVAGMLASWAGSQVVALGLGLGRGALNKGVDIVFNLNPFKDPIGVNCTVYK